MLLKGNPKYIELKRGSKYMYNIGIISSDNELTTSAYVDTLKAAECAIYHLELNDCNTWIDTIERLDALIIEEASIDNQMGIVCDTLIKLRERTSALIWVLSETADKPTRIVYMKLGADSIIDKTIDSDELTLIITKNLNRYFDKSIKGSQRSTELSQGGEQEKQKIKLIHSNFSVLLNGNQEVSLTKLEFQTIELLSNHVGEVLTYNEIYKNVWENAKGDKQYRVTNIIYHLRRKLEVNNNENTYIRTIRSKGYMLVN